MADMNRLAAFLEELRALRAKTVESEVDFFRRMADGEADESLWKGDPGAGTGYLTFAELLRAENMALVHRLEAYKAVVRELGLEWVREIGIDAAKLVATIPADAPSLKIIGQTARAGILQAAHDSRVRNRTTPSVQQVGTLRRQYYAPPPVAPRLVISDAERVRDMERQIARLEKDLARVTKERDAAIAKLEKQAAKGKPRKAAA